MEFARQRNSMPLPLVPEKFGLRLPPERYCLSGPNYRVKHKPKQVCIKPYTTRECSHTHTHTPHHTSPPPSLYPPSLYPLHSSILLILLPLPSFPSPPLLSSSLLVQQYHLQLHSDTNWPLQGLGWGRGRGQGWRFPSPPVCSARWPGSSQHTSLQSQT